MDVAKKIPLLLGFVLFLFILSRIDLLQVSKIFAAINLAYFAVALIVLGLVLFLKGLKWHILLAGQGINVSSIECSKYFCIGFFFGSFTPAKIGDFTRAFYLPKKNLATGLSSVFVDRLLDIIVLISFAWFSSFILLSYFGKSLISTETIVASLLAVIFGIIIMLHPSIIKFFARPFYKIFVPAKLKPFFSEGFDEFFSGFKSILRKKTPLFFSFCFTILSWVASAMFAYFIALSLNIGVNIEHMLVVLPLMGFADLLPFTVSGIGARDALLVLFFGLISLSSEQAIAFSVLLFITNYVVVAFAGYIFFTKKPIEISHIFDGLKKKKAF